MTIYPLGIDSSLNLPPVVDTISGVSAVSVNQLRDCLIAIETELGVKPSATYGTVKARLDALETQIGGLNTTAISLQNQINSIIAGGSGGSGTPVVFSGDLSGTSTNQSVIRIRGNTVANITPTDGQYLSWSTANSYWYPVTIATPTKSVQNGYNYGSVLDLLPFPNEPSTNQNIFVNAGTIEFNPNLYTAANGTRTIKLKVIGETTNPVMSIQLYNLTTNSIVTNTSLSISSQTATTIYTTDLSPYLTNGTAIYQVQIKMAVGNETDRVTMVYASFHIEWT